MASKPLPTDTAPEAAPADWAMPKLDAHGRQIAADGLPLNRAARLAALAEKGLADDKLRIVTAAEIAAYKGA
jgi:hypothetical protein